MTSLYASPAPCFTPKPAPCLAWVWPAGAKQPASDRLAVEGECALDRQLLGVADECVSRAGNAPVLTPCSARRVRLSVPTHCATGVVVIHGADFVSLQRGLCAPGRFEVGPEALGRRTKLAIGTRASLALLPSLDAGGPEPRAHLVPLPRARRVDPGSELVVDAPAIVVVGPAAVALQPGVSVAPNSALRELPTAGSFRLPKAGVTFAAMRDLDGLPEPEFTCLRVAGQEQPVEPKDVAQVGRALLTQVQRHFVFVPTLLDDHEPRLLLVYERQDGSVGSRLSTSEIPQWLGDIEELLRRRDPRQRSPITLAPLAASSAPIAPSEPAESAPEPAALATSRPLTKPPLSEPAGFGHVLTRDVRFASQLTQIAKVSDSPVGILLLGESGTGKDHLARAIHERSRRASKPFVAINCAALPEGLIESELFGHERGAFTGTTGPRAGAFVMADGGTLLLDEIGDASLRVQVALLRVLEERRVRALGSDRDRAVDVRVIAATSRDTAQLIAQGRFREDLYFRIAGLSVTLPPLRQRALDIPSLASTLLRGLGHSGRISEEALAQLCACAWPGNIRELRATLQLAVHLSAHSDCIGVEHLTLHASPQPAADTSSAGGQFPSAVIELADELWRSGALPALNVRSQYMRRARHRAALLSLAQRHGRESFPQALCAQWWQLFAPNWSSSENGRGFKNLCKVLALDQSEPAVRSWLLRVVGVA